jgi:DNA-binding beta-propeller fold protein YncE
MSSAAKRARPSALEASVGTIAIPGLGQTSGIFVLPDGTRLFSSANNTVLQLAPSGRLSTIAGSNQKKRELKDGEGTSARFNDPKGLTVDRAGNVVVVDRNNDVIRLITKEGAVVSTLAGDGQEDDEEDDEQAFYGQGASTRFNSPHSVVVVSNGDFIVSDQGNHCLRVVTPEGAVRTLCGNGQAGFADGQGPDARFNEPCGLALDTKGNLLVADSLNNAIRQVTMAGVVSTVAGNGVEGFADGAGAAARFNGPCRIVVDGEGTIVIADRDNHRLRKIVGGMVTTLAGSSESGTSDGSGTNARFQKPLAIALDERGRLLVAEYGRKDTLRVVEASLAPPLWMGPVEKAANDSEAPSPVRVQAALAALENYGKLLENGTLADVVLVVEGERFPAHRGVLAAQSEYFRGLFLSGMQGARSEGGVQEIEQVSAGAIRVVLRYLYTAELPESWEGGAGAGGGRGEDASVGEGRGGGKGKGSKGSGKGAGGDRKKSKEDGEEATRRQVLEREVLKAADLFRLEALLQHCIEAFGRGLKVNTAVEQLVWAHSDGPVEARTVANDYFLDHCRRIRVETICSCIFFLIILR